MATQTGTTDLGANIGSGGGAGGVTSLNGETGVIAITPGNGITVTPGSGTIEIAVTNPGTVSDVSIVTANGFSGTVADPTTTPAITLNTTITGVLKGNGTAISEAVVGTDYVIPSGSITGTASNITAISNSTLTSLPNLELPTTQLSGDISLTTQVSGILPVINGGTNATTIVGARSNLGIDAGSSFITSGTTYITPSTITTATMFKFTLIGGGGGGSSANAAADHSSTGGGGGGSILYTSGLTPSTSYTITIGSAGAGGASTMVGTAGGATSITIGATTYTASGGSNAAAVIGVGGVGGAGTNGTINITGQQGGPSMNVATSGGQRGGDSPWGWGLGGAGLAASTAGAGNPATGYGGGGSGAASTGANSGGNGSQGCILVEYYN